MNTQQRWFQQLQALVDADEDLELVVDQDFTNTGTIRLFNARAEEWTAVVQARFDFQTGYGRIERVHVNGRPSPGWLEAWGTGWRWSTENMTPLREARDALIAAAKA